MLQGAFSNRMALFVLGFLFHVAAGISLQTRNQKLSRCDGQDCQIEAPVGNKSEDGLGANFCECCWRDCDFHMEDMQDLHAEVSDGEAVVDSTIAQVDAWIIANCNYIKDKNWNMYTPILETVRVALEEQGSTSFLALARDLDKMIMGVKVAVAQGKRPLVFSVAHQWWDDVSVPLAKLKEAKEAGAYLVAYNAEPGFGMHGTLDQSTLAQALDMAARMGADEIWDYTMANIRHYPQTRNGPIIRYVPPGYLSKLDVGVDVNSPLLQASVIGYMGDIKNKTMSDTYGQLLGNYLHATNSVWGADDLRKYLETYPLQLNQHRWQTCCPREPWEAEMQHLESFRMATLLANKACVISGPSANEEMKLWQGLVTFAEVEDTMAAIHRVGRNLQACRLRSYETYKRDFAPGALLSKAGFFEVWRPPHGL